MEGAISPPISEVDKSRIMLGFTVIPINMDVAFSLIAHPSIVFTNSVKMTGKTGHSVCPSSVVASLCLSLVSLPRLS